jgi:hypothetical protein
MTLEKAGPGLWRSTVDVKVPGLYKLQTQAPTGTLHAVANAGIEDAREMSEVTATDEKLQAPGRSYRRRHVLDARGRIARERRLLGRRPAPHLHARQRPRTGRLELAGPQGPGGLCHPRVKLIPMFTGLLALAALLTLLALTWWREGR